MSSASDSSRPWWQLRLAEWIGIDPRSLALLRIALGLLLLVDLATRATDLRALHADDGILSIVESIDEAGAGSWSVYWLTDRSWFPGAVMGLAACLAVAVLVGCHTGWSLFFSWVLLVSLQNRNPLVINAGDTLLRMLLFWSMFLPLGRLWSVDANRRAVSPARPLKPVVSAASFCLLVQVALMYFIAGLTKANETWLGFDPWVVSIEPWKFEWSALGGDALLRTCHLDTYIRPAAGFLAEHPQLLRGLSLATVALELCGAPLLFFPLGTRYLRLVLIGAFLALHLAIELTVHVGLFSWVSFAAWTVFIPPLVWDSRLVQRMLLFWRIPVAAPPIPAGANDSAISHERRWPAWAERLGQITSATTCLALLLFAVWWNFTTLTSDLVRRQLQRPIRFVANATMIRQQWNMFSRPERTDTWFVYAARLENGHEVDLLRRDAVVSFAKPRDFSVLFPNHRWRKLHAFLDSPDYQQNRRPVADFLLRRWNASHAADEQVVRLEMYRMYEQASPEDSDLPPAHEICEVIETGSSSPQP